MILKYLLFIGKSNRKHNEVELDDKQIFSKIPDEIFVPKKMEADRPTQPPHNVPRATYTESRIKLTPTKSRIKLSQHVRQVLTETSYDTASASSNSNAHDDSARSDRLSNHTGIRQDLWRSASYSNEQIKLADVNCSNVVVQLMSRNGAARKKLLDDLLNHGEF